MYCRARKIVDRLQREVRTGMALSAQGKALDRFSDDPYAEVKRVVKGGPMGTPEFGAAEVDEFYRSLSDDTYNYRFDMPPGLNRPPTPHVPYERAFMSFSMFQRMVKKKKAGCAAAFNDIQYGIYKRCHHVLRVLHSLFVELNTSICKAAIAKGLPVYCVYTHRSGAVCVTRSW